MKKIYTSDIYHVMSDPARQAAQIIIPLVLDLAPIRSVVDLGCGTGEWLSVFKELGVQKVFGVDGEWVDKKLLKIASDEFMTHDLNRPLSLPDHFDLGVCLEVVGHIPEENADTLVDSLVSLAPLVLFSAPVLCQNPVGNLPVNNQWPEYWAARFKKRGYETVDALRFKVWDEPRVQYYYSQNIFLYASQVALDCFPRLKEVHRLNGGCALPLIHPDLYAQKVILEDFGLIGCLRMIRKLVFQLPKLVAQAVRRRLR